MPRLMLLRHAKAVPQNGMADEDRALAERGRADMAAISRFTAAHGLAPDLSLVSPAKRARETWDLLIADFAAPPAHRLEPRLYNASAEKLHFLIRETPEAVQTLLLVGHNPGFEELARALIGSGDTDALIRFGGSMPTASMAVIALNNTWTEIAIHRGRLELFASPRSLKSEID